MIFRIPKIIIKLILFLGLSKFRIPFLEISFVPKT